MHILIIPSWYPDNPKDVGGSFFREQAIGLHKRGHKVGVITPTLISLRKAHKKIKKIGQEIENDEGVNTYRFRSINITPRMKLLSRLHWVSLGIKLFSQYIKEYGKPDIIHVHSMNPAVFLAAKISDKDNIPYIITEHSTAFARGLIDNSTKLALQDQLENSSFNIAVSSPFSKLLELEFERTSWNYIPNIVSEKFIGFRVDTKNKDDFCFVNICLLTKKKCVDNLIEAFYLLTKDYSNISLKIGGDGSCKQELIELVKQLNIQDRVIFTGLLSREQVLSEMNDSDAFVLSSKYETFGVVLVEALALGKPVVATRCGGPESIVTDEVGVLVEKNDIQSLYQGMKSVYEKQYDPSLIRQYCQDNFSENAVLSSLEEIYNKAINKQ